MLWSSALVGDRCGSRPRRDKLRTVSIRDDRDEIAQELPRYGDDNGDRWADVIETLTMNPDVRRKAARLLSEIGAE